MTEHQLLLAAILAGGRPRRMSTDDFKQPASGDAARANCRGDSQGATVLAWALGDRAARQARGPTSLAFAGSSGSRLRN